VILVDGSNMLHRGLHTAQADLKDSKGTYTGGLHSFLSSLSTAALKHQLKHSFIVAWDLGLPLFRRQLYKEYKPFKDPIGDIPDNLKSEANLSPKEKEATTDEFLAKYAATRKMLHSQFLPLSGCLSIQVKNCEADDIISYVCHKIKDEKIIIYSTDRDLMQLMTDNVEFYDGRDLVTHTVDTLIADNDLVRDSWKAHWLTIRAVAGDTSDGIPGFTGWETARKYAAQLMELQHTRNYTLYDSLARLERPPGARVSGYEALKHGHDMIIRNFRLMDLMYPIDNKLPIVDDIRAEIASAFIYDIDLETLEGQLHNMAMRAAKTFVSNIIESNMQNDVKEYIKKLVM
jgi:5'-3' exonuclease